MEQLMPATRNGVSVPEETSLAMSAGRVVGLIVIWECGPNH